MKHFKNTWIALEVLLGALKEALISFFKVGYFAYKIIFVALIFNFVSAGFQMWFENSNIFKHSQSMGKLYYFRDEQSGLCFAANNGFKINSNSGVIVNIPCTKEIINK